MSNSLDPDQDRHFVGPALGPNCLQKCSADEKSHCQLEKRVARVACLVIFRAFVDLTYLKICFFIKFFQEHYQSVK